MCAYSEDRLILTRAYPFATRENHIHSRNALHCVTKKQRSSLQEPHTALEHGKQKSPGDIPRSADEGKR